MTQPTVTSPAVKYPWGHAAVAVIVLLGGVAATLLTASQESRVNLESSQRSFDVTTANIADQTRLQLSRYEDLLGTFQALHRPGGPEGGRDLGSFLDLQASGRSYPGYQAAGVILGPPQAAWRDPARADIEPQERTPESLGLTREHAATLRRAMLTATTSGQPSLTAPIPASEDAENFVMYAPLYESGTIPDTATERRAASIGWVAVVFQADRFFSDILPRYGARIGIEVFDGTAAGKSMAVHPRHFSGDDSGATLTAVSAAGRLWTLRTQPLAVARTSRSSEGILVAGLAITFLAALFIAAAGGARRRTVHLVATTTADLGRSEQRFRSLAASSPLGIFWLTADGQCEYANERLCQLTGRNLDDLLGQGLRTVYHPDDQAALGKAVTRASNRAAALRLRIVLPDGTLRWVKTHAAPLRDDHLGVTGWVGSVEDVTTEVEAQIAGQQLSAKLEHQARHDHLTGLPNRTFFTEQITTVLTDDDIPGVAVLFFDLDRFKIVNDSLGHDAGDRLLVEVAQRLGTAVRPGDIVARFGGDEFVIGLMGVTDSETATDEADRLLADLTYTICLDGHEISVTVSMGVALSTVDCDADELLTWADTAMYQAKARGKACYQLYRPATPIRNGESTLELERDLRKTIDTGGLRLAYQPLTSLSTGQIVGVEALVRWDHPDRGAMSPAEFIPVAEESRLILPLGAWVLREACSQLQRWGPVVDDQFTVTVNVSARQLADPLFPSVVATALSDYSVRPTSVCLEITESALLQDLTRAEQALHELRSIGVRIAVDDFGTGYSSLTHLKLLPIDMLKIDRSFVADLGESADTTAIVGAVIRMAAALGLTSVAEGVEKLEQLEWLSSMGCDLVQGFYLARPQDADAIGAMLVARSTADVPAPLAPAAG